MGIGKTANNHVLCSCAKYSWADDTVQVVKNEMWASEVCFACLTWLYGLLERSYHLQTHKPKHTSSFLAFLTWVAAFSLQVDLKVYSNEL